MSRIGTLIDRFGGQSELARLLGTTQSTVQYWASKGRAPSKWHRKIIEAGKSVGLLIDPLELQPSRPAPVSLVQPDASYPISPFAKWRGQIDLGGDELDVYVLDTGQRVISTRAAIKSFTSTDSGNLGNYIGIAALKPFINSDLILGELLEFSIPGTQFLGRGMTTEHFELICRGYVQALYERVTLTDRQRYSPADCTGIIKKPIEGKPDPKHISTSYAERQNLTMRMSMRRFTRLTNAFSKKFENHAHMVAIYAVHYNFLRIHKTLRVSPAMAANLSETLLSWMDVVAMMDADTPAKKRGAYRKRALV
jgi:hypothetical protein